MPTVTLEERVAALETEVARLKQARLADAQPRKPWWSRYAVPSKTTRITWKRCGSAANTASRCVQKTMRSQKPDGHSGYRPSERFRSGYP